MVKPNSSPKNTHETLEGELERVIFTADDGDFAVVVLKTEDGLQTAAGNLEPLDKGTYLRLHGHWTTHPKFGQQFRADWSEQTTPTTLEGLRKYLGSGIFPGIGTEMAKRMVATFGDRTLEALEIGTAELRKVTGIGPKRAEALANYFREGRDKHRVMAELRGFGLNGSQARTVYEEWGAGAVAQVRKDPWGLIDHLRGVGFQTAERIASQLGLPKDSLERGRGLIRHLLKEGAREGHCCVLRDELWSQLENLGLSQETVAAAAAELVAAGRLVENSCQEQVWWYLSGLWQDESGLADNLLRLCRQGLTTGASATQIENAIARAEYHPDESQRAAMECALENSLAVITGGPGTGKTTTLRLLLDIFEASCGGEIRLASPTGRAAKRLQEATGRNSSTLHRLLGFEPHSGKFRHDENNPIEAAMVVVDEASMMDLPLAHALMRAIPNGCRLLLVGDADQLPSVGPGSVLRNLVAAPEIPTVRLAHIHRQEFGSGISAAAHAILEGEVPLTMTGTGGDFFATYRDDPEEAAAMVEKIVCERIPEKYGLDPRRDILVLSPMYKGTLGVDAINQRLGARLNPQPHGDGDSDDADNNSRGLVVGDKVMVVRNDYDREVFNGDTGVVTALQGGGATIEIEGRVHEYSSEEITDLMRAWCVTVHRSQGSEAPAVVIVLGNSHYMMLRRNLLYTAVTRGKQLVTVVASRWALKTAIGNATENRRNGLLGERIAGLVVQVS